jgi:hypothetical protein
VNRLARYYPIAGISMELVKFDTQLLENPGVSGIEYQLGFPEIEKQGKQPLKDMERFGSLSLVQNLTRACCRHGLALKHYLTVDDDQ